jgi:hypothetical protein
MRRLILSLAVAAVIGTGLAAALPTPAHAQWGGGGYYGYDHDGWRERAWREHRWREWMWRRHMGHEWREHHYDRH